MTTRDEMTKAQRLELAAIEAPILRNASEKTLARRVALVDKNGKVTGYTSGREVLRGLAKANGLEHVVDDALRPKKSKCKICQKRLKVPKSGPVPTECRWGCPAICAAVGCGKRISEDSVAKCRRLGKPRPRCQSCAIKWRLAHETPEQKANRITNHRAAVTPERRAMASRLIQAANDRSQARRAARATTPSPTPKETHE